VKWDGYRCMLVSEDGRARLVSRNLKDLTADYPHVAAAVKSVTREPFMLDGELVAARAGNAILSGASASQRQTNRRQPEIRLLLGIRIECFSLQVSLRAPKDRDVVPFFVRAGLGDALTDRINVFHEAVPFRFAVKAFNIWEFRSRRHDRQYVSARH
jgi:ATP dependent DNA ligase domain